VTNLSKIIHDPKTFADHLLQEAPSWDEAELIFRAEGFERVDDEGDHLRTWTREAWSRSGLGGGLWRHPSWPEGVVVHDQSGGDPAWGLSTWDIGDEAFGVPAGYVHEYWGSGDCEEVRLRPFA